MTNLIEELKGAFSTEDFDVKISKLKRHVVRVSGTSLIAVAEFCKETLGFDHAISVSIVDNPKTNQFVVYYHLSSLGQPRLRGHILTLEVVFSRDSPRTPSLIDIWPSVEWHEREGWEMYGIEFEGHPKLERLLLPEDWKRGYPLRKDFEKLESDS